MSIKKISKEEIDFSHIYGTKYDAENHQNSIKVNEVYWGDNGDLFMDDKTGLITENGVALGFVNQENLHTNKNNVVSSPESLYNGSYRDDSDIMKTILNKNDDLIMTNNNSTLSNSTYNHQYDNVAVNNQTSTNNDYIAPLKTYNNSNDSISPSNSFQNGIQSDVGVEEVILEESLNNSNNNEFSEERLTNCNEINQIEQPKANLYQDSVDNIVSNEVLEHNTVDNNSISNDEEILEERLTNNNEINQIEQPKENIHQEFDNSVKSNEVEETVDNNELNNSINSDLEEDIDTEGFQTKEEQLSEKDKETIKMIQSIHDQHLSVPDYRHNCGYLVSDQLSLLGLTDRNLTKYGSGKLYAKSLAANDSTINGHYAVGYETNSSNQRDIFENIIADNNGKLDNLVISFNKGGSFSSNHGHVMLINKIENGRVYFVDNWKMYRNNSKKGYNATSITIEEFENQYLKSSNNSNYMTHIV